MSQIAWYLLLGLEITRFAPVDDGADGLGTSLDAAEAGGQKLGAYEGPALQPVLSAGWAKWTFGVAPGIAGRLQTLTSSDGREGNLSVFQWRLEGRVRYGDRVFAELDVYGSSGSATLDREPVAVGTSYWGLAPSAGARLPLADGLWLSGRARWPWRFEDGTQSNGLGGAVALEWRPGHSGDPSH